MKLLKLNFAIQNFSKKERLFLFFFTLVLVVPLLTNILRARNLHINAVDFSTYQQPIYEIADGNSLNPYSGVRNLKILNDHFDPAIYIAAIFVKIFGESIYTLLFFEWIFYFLAVLSIFDLTMKETKSTFSAMFNVFIVMFSRGVLQGVEFPIHPTTWSLFPSIWATYYLYKDEFKKFVLFFLITCTFREMYYFSLPLLAFYYLYTKDFKKGATLLLFTLFLLIVLFKLRPLFLGQTVAYDNGLKTALLSFDISSLIKMFFPINTPWNIFVPLAALASVPFLLKQKNFRYKENLIKGMLFILPGILIHEMIGRMAHHQSIPFLASFFSLFVFINWEILLNRKKLFLALILLVFFTASSRYTKMIKYIFAAEYVEKIDFSEKRKSYKNLKKVIDAQPEGMKYIGTGTVVPHLVKSGRAVFNIADTGPYLNDIDILVIERNGKLIPFPLNFDQVNEIEMDCKAQANSVLYEDFFFLALKGNINQKCLRQKHHFNYHNPLTL